MTEALHAVMHHGNLTVVAGRGSDRTTRGMIISRTPLLMSFVGGGSDLPSFYRKHGGAVVSTAINKFVYITLNEKFDHRIRVELLAHGRGGHRRRSAASARARGDEAARREGRESKSLPSLTFPRKGRAWVPRAHSQPVSCTRCTLTRDVTPRRNSLPRKRARSRSSAVASRLENRTNTPRRFRRFQLHRVQPG